MDCETSEKRFFYGAHQRSNPAKAGLACSLRLLTTTMALALVGFTISACGIKGPLVRPSDIPQYEREHRHTKELYTPDIQPQGRP